jgi:hypothetical protein
MKNLETDGYLVGYYDYQLRKATIVYNSDALNDSKQSRNRFHRGTYENLALGRRDTEKRYYVRE